MYLIPQSLVRLACLAQNKKRGIRITQCFGVIIEVTQIIQSVGSTADFTSFCFSVPLSDQQVFGEKNEISGHLLRFAWLNGRNIFPKWLKQ